MLTSLRERIAKNARSFNLSVVRTLFCGNSLIALHSFSFTQKIKDHSSLLSVRSIYKSDVPSSGNRRHSEASWRDRMHKEETHIQRLASRVADIWLASRVDDFQRLASVVDESSDASLQGLTTFLASRIADVQRLVSRVADVQRLASGVADVQKLDYRVAGAVNLAIRAASGVRTDWYPPGRQFPASLRPKVSCRTSKRPKGVMMAVLGMSAVVVCTFRLAIGFKQMLCTVATCYWFLALLWFYKTRSFLSGRGGGGGIVFILCTLFSDVGNDWLLKPFTIINVICLCIYKSGS
jgi:hypothetical protein